jgi:hypothetical protein
MAEVECEDLNAAELAVVVAIGEINETGPTGAAPQIRPMSVDQPNVAQAWLARLEIFV